MITIYKYPVPVQDIDTSHGIPEGAEILSVQMQNDTPCIWALVDTDMPLRQRKFRVYGTGHEITAERINFIGTVQESPFVWHIFEVIRP